MPSHKDNIIIICIFLVIIFFMTFPLSLHFNSYIPGFSSSDEPFAALQRFWWLKFSFLNHYQWTNEFVTAYPFGEHHEPVFIAPLWFQVGRFISIVSNWILAYNLPIFCNFIIGFISMFYLFFLFSKDKFISFFVGIVYALCPYQFARFWQHYSLVFTGFMPLYLLSLIKLHKYRTRREVFLCALILSLVISLELHYAFFMLLTTLLFMLYSVISGQELQKGKLSKLYLFTLLVVMIASLIVLNRSFFGKLVFAPRNIVPSGYVAIRPFEDLFTQSARPLSYLLPAITHPVFGRFTEQFIGSPLYGESMTEHTLYLGWAPLILAFVGVRRYCSQRKKGAKDFYAGFFIILAVMAWIFSQPPWWRLGSLRVYMPSFFIYKVLPVFRAYCRFGILVMLAVSILAGFGLKSFLERFKSPKVKTGITFLFCALVLFEFWNWPPYKVIDLSRAPAVYYWLKVQPKGTVIAEYPIDSNGASEWYKLYQTVHEKSTINGTIPGTYPNRIASNITKLSAKDTPATLAWLGVRYVLVHRQDYLKTDEIAVLEDLNNIPKNTGLKFVRNFPQQNCAKENIACIEATGPIDVYEVVASAIKPTVKQE